MVKKYLLLFMGLFFACLYPLEAHADAMPDVIRYEELETLVKASSPQIQMEQAQYDSRLARYENAREEIMETRRLLREEAEDLEKNGDKDSAGQYRAQAKTLEDAAKDMDKQIRSAQGSQASMSLRRMEDTVSGQPRILWAPITPLKRNRRRLWLRRSGNRASMRSCCARSRQEAPLPPRRTRQEKRLMRQLPKAKAVQDEMERVKKELIILTGYPEGSQAEVGPMPAPRPERVLEMGGSTDKWRALGNNYSLREQRSGGASSNKELHARQRDIRQSEEAMYGQLDTLYQDVLASQTLWTSAATSMASQEAAFQAASNKLALGMLSRQEYLEAKSGLHGRRRCQRKGRHRLPAGHGYI